jgi:hypothetical protein
LPGLTHLRSPLPTRQVRPVAAPGGESFAPAAHLIEQRNSVDGGRGGPDRRAVAVRAAFL